MIQPMGNRALVKRFPKGQAQSALIEVVELEETLSQFAVVLAIGKLREGGFSVGDTVILKDYSGTPCPTEIDGERIESDMVVEDDVLAVIEEE